MGSFAGRSIFLAVVLMFPPLTASTHAAPLRTISGRLKGVNVSGFPIPPSTVRAFRLYSPFHSASAQLPATGIYQLSVPAGPYIIVSDVWKANRAPQTSIRFVSAGRVRSTGVRSVMNLTLPGTVVSVGDIRWVNSSGTPHLTGDGRVWRFDGMFITSLANQPARCDVSVAEDRSFGKYKELLKEIKLRSSAAVAPSSRLNAQSAKRTLNLWQPRFRVTGSLISDSDSPATFGAELRLVDLKDGKAIWSRNYTVAREDFFSFSDRVAADVIDEICGSPLPSRIEGGFSGSFLNPVLGTTENWSGAVSFKLDTPELYKNLTRQDGIGLFAVYTAERADIQWNISGGSECSFSGSATASIPTPGAGALLQLEVSPEAGQERRYMVSGLLDAPDPTSVTMRCGEDEAQLPKVWGASLTTSDSIETAARMAGTTLVGGYSEDASSWSWSLTALP